MSKHSDKDILRDVRDKTSADWERVRKQHILRIFNAASKRVPAYKDFLTKNNVDVERTATFADFARIPLTSKKTYLRQYPHDQLYWDGSLSRQLTFTATSGSTGDPFYFSRTPEIEQQYSTILELFHQNGSHDPSKPTLVIVCFGMGLWIGGTITYRAFEMVAERGYPISIITPGINKEEIFKTLKNVAPHFSQVIMAGYPPFIKDIVDEAPERGIRLSSLHVRFVFAAESFTERFREYIVKKAGIRDPLCDTMNIYGSADIGAMAFETPLTVLVRKLAAKRPPLAHGVMPGADFRTPTLAQYIPSFVSFEAQDGEIALTGDNAMPLVRYAIGDRGGTFSYDQLVARCEEAGIDLSAQAKHARIANKMWQLPFVYVYERVDMAASIYGLQVYPETIREVLLLPAFSKMCTGKLTLITKFDKALEQYLEINIELQSKLPMNASLRARLLASITENLIKKNAEFRELSNFLGTKRKLLTLVSWPKEEPLYFKQGVKQQWVKQELKKPVSNHKRIAA